MLSDFDTSCIEVEGILFCTAIESFLPATSVKVGQIVKPPKDEENANVLFP